MADSNKTANGHAIQAVVFDLDGLMLNTEDVFNLAGSELVARRGKVMTRECHHLMLGRRPQEAFEIMVELLEINDPIDALLSESRAIFESLIDEHLGPMPGLHDLLELVDQRLLPKGVATSSPRFYLDDMLKRFALNERFHFTLTAEDVSQGKPHPEIYEKAAELAGVATTNMLVLEDSEAGARAAAAAGAVVVAVPNTHTAEQDFSMASYVAKSLHDPLVVGLLG